MRVRFLALFLLLAWPASAQSEMEAAFAQWVKQRDVAPATFVALGPDGRRVASVGVGAPVAQPLPIASIAKTLTGQCVMHLVRQGRLRLNDKISAHLAWQSPQGDVTIRQLMTHTSAIGPDGSQMDISGRYRKNKDHVARAVNRLAQRPLLPQKRVFSYNNENYFVLETILQKVVKSDVMGWCHKNVPALRTLKTLSVAPTLRAWGLAGGYALSAADLARFFSSLRKAGDWPMAKLNKVSAYGPGVIIQKSSHGETLFHTGGHCSPVGPRHGAFAARLGNGASVGVLFTGCIKPEDIEALNTLLLNPLSR